MLKIGALADTNRSTKDALAATSADKNNATVALTARSMNLASPPLTYRTGLLTETGWEAHKGGGKSGRAGKDVQTGPRNVAAEVGEGSSARLGVVDGTDFESMGGLW